MIARFDILALAGFALLFARPVWSQDRPAPAADPPAVDEAATDQPPKTPTNELSIEQGRVADKYSRLEELMFKMADFEAQTNPRRAALLKQAYKQSKDKLTLSQLNAIVKLLSQKKLRNAVEGQEAAEQDLKTLLQLLLTENRSDRLKSEQQKIKDYIKELKRLERLQRSERGRNEGGAQFDDLAKNQGKLADRTGDLAKQVKELDGPPGTAGEPKPPANGTEGEPKDQDDQEGKDQEGAPAAGEGKEGQPPEGESKPGEGQPGQKPEGQEPSQPGEGQEQPAPKPEDKPQEKSEQPAGEEAPKPGEEQPPGEPGAPGAAEPKDAQGKPGKPSKSPPGGQPSESEGGDEGGQEQQPSSEKQQQQSEFSPAQKRIREAEEKMREARQRLEEAKRNESIEAQREAEKKLEEAIAELEEILRQMREEEMKRVLALLEGRFRKMLEMELKVYESTVRLDKIPAEQRGRDVDVRANRLSFDQRKIVMECDQCLTLLREEASSIAFPEVVDMLREDMEEVSNRLAEIKVDSITQGIEEEIIQTLEELIAALQKAQQEMDEKQGETGPPGEEGDPPLVDALAELRMIRSMQLRVNKRTQRFSRLLDDADDPKGQATDADVQRALMREAEREAKIQQITRDLVLGKNK